MKTQKTGDDIDSYCGHCRMELAHVIVSMLQGKVARVQCKTCGSLHNARKTQAPSSRGSTAKTRSTKGPSRSSYDELLAGRDISRAKRYQPSQTYVEGDVMNHPTFGLGLVTRALADSKIEAIFPQGGKVLIHGRA